jgi:hypothetical protein
VQLKGCLLLLVLIAPMTQAQAQDAGVVNLTGTAITPSDEGKLLRLYTPKEAKAGLTAYTLVAKGGEAVVVMNAAGQVLTPDEVWNTYGPGPHRPQSKPVVATVPTGGTFSVPNTH